MNKILYYAGIGSRETPEKILTSMINIATELSTRGYILRSGGAEGADSAFEEGCDKVKGKKEIFIPWRGFNNKLYPPTEVSVAAMKIAQKLHPAWDKCSKWARVLHGRNVYQILGIDLKTPCEFVVAWTPQGRLEGGTATALRLAIEKQIPIYNLGSKNGIQIINEALNLDINTKDSFEYQF